MSLEPPNGPLQDPGLSENTKRWISELYKNITGTGWHHLETLDVSSGTSATTTNKPPGTATRFFFVVNLLSTDGANDILVQIGTPSGLVTSGYTGSASRITGGASSDTSFSSGFQSRRTAGGDNYIGTMDIARATPNSQTWVYSANLADNGGGVVAIGAGQLALGGDLTQIKILPTGADDFDGSTGSVDIWYHG